MLGNLTENALNACKLQQSGRRYLRARARIVHGVEAVITIENSCADGDDGPAAREAAGIAPSKELGIPSIRAVAQKYHGTARFERKGDEFTAGRAALCADRAEGGRGGRNARVSGLSADGVDGYMLIFRLFISSVSVWQPPQADDEPCMNECVYTRFIILRYALLTGRNDPVLTKPVPA